MCWLFAFIIIIAAIVYVVFANGKNKPEALKKQKFVRNKQGKEDDFNDIDNLEMYIDEVDENGEPW